MSSTSPRFFGLPKLIADVLRYLLKLGVDAVRDLVRIPFIALKAVGGLLGSKGRPTRILLARLLIDTVRDLVLVPLTLAAAGVDGLLSPLRPPALFYALKRFDQRCETLLDNWFDTFAQIGARVGSKQEVLAGVHEALSNPERSVRRARAIQRRALRLKKASP